MRGSLIKICYHIFRYFADILKETPESVEGVEVETDGEWHTEDNKYGSPSWLAKHPPKAAKAPVARQHSGPSSSNSAPTASGSSSQANGTRRKPNDVVVLDDSDDEEGRVKKELSPSVPLANGANRTTSTGSKASSSVIDLTLDSDYEDSNIATAPLTTKRLEKRKADDVVNGRVELTHNKRQRADESAHLPPPPALPRRDSSTHGSSTNNSSAPLPTWNGNPRPSGSSYREPASRQSSNERPSHTFDTYRERTNADGHPYSSGSYSSGMNGHGGQGVPFAQPNDPRRLPPPVPYANHPYLPRLNGNEPSRWP